MGECLINGKIVNPNKDKLKKIDLIVVRYTKDGIPSVSRPCNLCMDFLRSVEGIIIRKIYYFNYSGQLISENFKYMNKMYTTKGCEIMDTQNIKYKTVRNTGKK